MKQLKISFLSVILGLKWTIFFVLGYYLFIFLIFRDIRIFEMWYTHIWPIITIIPDIFIITEYFVEDYKKKIMISNYHIIDERTGKKYPYNEIQKIIIHKSNSERYKIMSFMYYQFAEVILKNNDKIFITTLMNSNIDEFLKENLKGVYFDRNFNNFL